MPGDWVVGGILGAVLLLLAIEAMTLRRLQRRIGVRIAVAGTRGKSSTVRLIAAGLSACGHRVTYKTTGSLPVIGLPSGEERRLRRWGLPTPLEQRHILRAAARAGSTALVAEAMSIRGESLRTELQRILNPQWVVVTNIRTDHTADLPDPERAFAAAPPARAAVLCPDTIAPRFIERVRRVRGGARNLRLIQTSAPSRLNRHGAVEWGENIALAAAVCEAVGADPATVRDALDRVRPDIGALRAWHCPADQGDILWVNAFAANDPESTVRALGAATTRWQPTRVVGLLNLRRDRGDRTLQWIRTLTDGRIAFDRLVLIGDVPRLSLRPLRRAYGERLTVLPSRRPEDILATIRSDCAAGTMVFGLGNIGGIGLRLVETWQREGEPA